MEKLFNKLFPSNQLTWVAVDVGPPRKHKNKSVLEWCYIGQIYLFLFIIYKVTDKYLYLVHKSTRATVRVKLYTKDTAIKLTNEASVGLLQGKLCIKASKNTSFSLWALFSHCQRSLNSIGCNTQFMRMIESGYIPYFLSSICCSGRL